VSSDAEFPAPKGPGCVVRYSAERIGGVGPWAQYRARFGTDPDFIEADRIRDDSGCVLRYERTFMRPMLPGPPAR
jgi:hypothetical protein